jgi:hypothetical protein
MPRMAIPARTRVWRELQTHVSYGDMLKNTETRPVGGTMPEKSSVTLPGTVEKIITPVHPSEPEKAQINIEAGATPLYKEIRIENTLTDENGEEVKLKKGAEVEIAIKASPSGVLPKP